MTIQLSNLQNVFALIKAKTADTRVPMAAAAEVIRSSISKNIREGGRWDGNASTITLFSGGTQRWTPLSPSTNSARKRRGRRPENLLRDTGQLNAATTVRPAGNTIVISNNKVYAAAQNFGATLHPVIPVTPQMRKYFWAQWFATGDAKFKGMALTKKKTFNPTIVIPPRPFMVISQEDIDEIAATFADWLEL